MSEFYVGCLVKRIGYHKSSTWQDFILENPNGPYEVVGVHRLDGYLELKGGTISFCSDNFAVVGSVKAQATADAVNNPSHYASGDIECIDAIEASMSREAFCGYLKGNVQKYMWRYEKKINPVEDLKKAQWYQNRLIQTLEKQ